MADTKRIAKAAAVGVMLSTACSCWTSSDCEFKLLPDQRKLEMLAIDRMEEYLGLPGCTGGHNPYVEWCYDVCDDPTSSAENKPAVIRGGVCYAGMCTHGGKIYVADWGRMTDGALVHEIGHWALIMCADGDGDADHSMTDWWDYVNDINQEMRDRGW